MTDEAEVPNEHGAAWMMVAAATLLGIGTVLRQLDVSTFIVVLALMVSCLAVLAPGVTLLRGMRHRSVVMVIVTGVVLLALAFASQTTLPAPHRLALLALAALGIHAVVAGGRWRTAELCLVVGGHFVLMAVMLATSGQPDIDVYDFQQQASAALLRGENPYGLRFLNTAGPGSPYYAPEVLDGDRLRFGFIYPPVSLLMALPGYIITGDYRYSGLVALSITALLIVLMRPGALAAGAALLVLFAPTTQFVLYWGWTDPFVTFLFAATTCLAVRRLAVTPVALGFLIASKQYVAPFLVVAVVLLRAVRLRVGVPAFVAFPLTVAAATVAPFAAWDTASFVYSTVTAHLLQPFRDDSLSIPALLVRNGFAELPGALGFVAGAVALALVLWRGPRTPAGFAAGCAVVLMAFFLFSKQAFLHYYFVPLVALAIGCAVTGAGRAPPPTAGTAA